MHAIRQKCRPKHQVLILKCYPRTTKGAVDVKPNSSELSYLLYYATTRRSKVQKVGAFLEKKTASDVWRARIGNVQVTLQILEALIEKAPRDLPLYAPYVLKILRLILQSGDITMVEASIPTFEAFCEHHDMASLSADQEYLKMYEEIVRSYAAFASTRQQPTKLPMSAPVAMRWRVAGLQAVKSVASSEALASVAGRQLHVIVPILLENIWTDNQSYLETIFSRASMEDKVDTERLLRRRTSIATVRTVDTSTETNAATISGSTADADKLAEEDIGVLAIQCLKHIFSANNRSQIRGGVLTTIKFIEERVNQNEVLIAPHHAGTEDWGWATTVFIQIARWTPVQERYTIMVTTMEALVRSPLTEESVPQQLVLATMIDSLLRSDVNLIGLSVMDVLLGLIQHVLRTLQLSGVDPHFQPKYPVGEVAPSKTGSKEISPSTSIEGVDTAEIVQTPSVVRKDLLHRLEHCIGDLATHVYYADQISDMISAILLRLKPATLSAIPSQVAAIEDPQGASNALTASANIVEDPKTDGFFSFDTAKVCALTAIKYILLVATRKWKNVGASLGRNRVGVKVWEGTQWLLRDPDGRVRKAYVDALLTWLDREMTKDDLVVFDDKPSSPHKGLVKNGGEESTESLSKRAVSNASHREKPAKIPRTTFLQLLHLAVYENALQYTDSEPDVVLLHLLLTKLVDKLGVNAVKSGLPMVFRLQEDIQEAETIAKVRMGSICHGYFWALSEKFFFESSGIGREIHQEIYRRQSKGFWVQMVRIPPVPLDQLGMPGTISAHQGLPMHELESESLKPFDDRETMVELIAISYAESVSTLLGSPAASPGRNFSGPILGGHTTDVSVLDSTIPEKVKDQMLSDWSREAILAGVQEGSKTASLSGSRSGTNKTGQGQNFLTVNGGSGTASPHSHQYRSRPPSQAHGLVGGLAAMSKLRQSRGPDTPSDSSKSSITRVDQLKRVLSGQAPPSRGFGAVHSDASSESMMSYDITQSELSYDNRGNISIELVRQTSNGTRSPRSKSRDRSATITSDRNPLSSHPIAGEEGYESEEDLEAVPPVPPLPISLSLPSLPGGFPLDPSQERLAAAPPSPPAHHEQYTIVDLLKDRSPNRGGLKSRGGQSVKGSLWARDPSPAPGIDLEMLLKGIDTKGDGRIEAGVVKPPY